MLMVDVVRSGGGLTWEEPKCEIQCPGLGKKTCFFVLSFFDSRRYDAFLVFFSRRLRVCRLPRLPRLPRLRAYLRCLCVCGVSVVA